MRCFVIQFPAYGDDESQAAGIIEDIIHDTSVVGYHVKGDITRLETDLGIQVAGGPDASSTDLLVYDAMGLIHDVLGDRLLSDVGPGKL